MRSILARSWFSSFDFAALLILITGGMGSSISSYGEPPPRHGIEEQAVAMDGQEDVVRGSITEWLPQPAAVAAPRGEQQGSAPELLRGEEQRSALDWLGLEPPAAVVAEHDHETSQPLPAAVAARGGQEAEESPPPPAAVAAHGAEESPQPPAAVAAHGAEESPPFPAAVAARGGAEEVEAGRDKSQPLEAAVAACAEEIPLPPAAWRLGPPMVEEDERGTSEVTRRRTIGSPGQSWASLRNNHDAVVERQARYWREFHGAEGRSNIGWGVFHFGTLPSEKHPKRISIDNQLKASPAQIIGVIECPPALEEMLKQSGERDDVDLRAAAETCEDPQLRGIQTLASRPRSQYLTLRVRGHPSLMIGVRESFGRKVKRVNCWTDDMGSHKTAVFPARP